MNKIIKTGENCIKELESLQARLGELQVRLLKAMVGTKNPFIIEDFQNALIKLEAIQRSIGEVQIELLEALSAQKYRSEKAEKKVSVAGQEKEIAEVGVSQPVIERAQNIIIPVDWLKSRGIKIVKLRRPDPMDEMANRAAFSLGLHFNRLRDFYETIKKRVNGANITSFSMKGRDQNIIGISCQFAQALYKSELLKKYEYDSSKKCIEFDVETSGKIKNFFTGEWLERFVSQLIRNAIHRFSGKFVDSQVIMGVHIQLPNHTEAELDVLAGLPGEKIMWVECKTGEWQKYLGRFRNLNNKYLKIPRKLAILALLDDVTLGQQEKAMEYAQMTVLPIRDLADWINKEVFKAAHGLNF